MIRNLFIAGLLISGLWAAATVPLGTRTLAEHFKAIGETEEAQELVEGAKSKIGPSLGKIKSAVLGEVEKSVGRMQREILDEMPGSGTELPEPAEALKDLRGKLAQEESQPSALEAGSTAAKAAPARR